MGYEPVPPCAGIDIALDPEIAAMIQAAQEAHARRFVADLFTEPLAPLPRVTDVLDG